VTLAFLQRIATLTALSSALAFLKLFIINALFAWLISHQPAVLFSQNKPATSNQPTVLFSQNKLAPAISHQPTEQVAKQRTTILLLLEANIVHNIQSNKYN
jgi:hypothetical protein